MPLYKFVCLDCAEPTKKLMDSGASRLDLKCKCGGSLVRDASPPNSVLYEALDNGAMPRRLERLQNAEELYRDRAASDPRRKRV
jgi:hypothetical protein